jgi:hypothetical protein
MLLPQADYPATIQEKEAPMAACFDTVEWILGAPAWSLDVFERGVFSDWLLELQPDW